MKFGIVLTKYIFTMLKIQIFCTSKVNDVYRPFRNKKKSKANERGYS